MENSIMEFGPAQSWVFENFDKIVHIEGWPIMEIADSLVTIEMVLLSYSLFMLILNGAIFRWLYDNSKEWGSLE